MPRVTILTNDNHYVDIVDNESEVKHDYYILKKNISKINEYLESNNTSKITNGVAKELTKVGLLKKTETPF